MVPLLAPILAQLVTLNLGARTEARYVGPTDESFQAEIRPTAGVRVGWKHSAFSLGYVPDILIEPLETTPRHVTLYHSIGASYSLRIRHTTISLSESFGFGALDLGAAALGDRRANGGNATIPTDTGTGTGTGMTPPTGMPVGTGTPVGTTPGGTATGNGATPGTGTGTAGNGRPFQQNQVLRLETSATNLTVIHQFSAIETASATASYVESGGLDTATRNQYPLFQGIGLVLGYQRYLDRTNALTSALASQYGWTGVTPGLDGAPDTPGAGSWVFNFSEGLTHAFNRRTNGRAAIGVSYGLSPQPNGSLLHSIYPTFDTSLNHVETLSRGTLSISGGASSAPALNPAYGSVDPRLTFFAAIGWGREKFSIGLSGNTTLSIASGNEQGGQDFVGGAARIGYQVAKPVGVDAGVRGVWQTFNGLTEVPPTYAAYVGLTFGLSKQLH